MLPNSEPYGYVSLVKTSLKWLSFWSMKILEKSSASIVQKAKEKIKFCSTTYVIEATEAEFWKGIL